MIRLLKSRYSLIAGLYIIILLIGQTALSQVTIHGTVFDISKKGPLEGVSVISNSGKGTSTDVLGKYSIRVNLDDSIYFSYLGKPTPKFAVKEMVTANNFDISLHVNSNILPEVFVRAPSYKMDSLQNRLDYAKIFNYRKPGIGVSMMPAGSGQSGVGFDMDELIDIFRYKKKKSMLAVQERMLQQEQDKYIDHRFSKGLVKKITNLDGEALIMFMRLNRPSYEFTVQSNEYDFYEYIKQRSERFKADFLSPEKKDTSKSIK